MQQRDMHISVYVIPGDERASLRVYDTFVRLLEMHQDLFLSVYRGLNRADGRWVLTLIGEKTSLFRYQEQIQRLLLEARAELITVPPESLAPLIERFLVRQAEMMAKNTLFFMKHHPLGKEHYAKKAARPKKRKKKGR